MLIKKEILKLSQDIKDNKLSQAMDRLNKMIAFKSTYPNCCSNCSGHGFKGSVGCKKDSHQSWNTRLKDFKLFLLDHINNNINNDYFVDALDLANLYNCNDGTVFCDYFIIPALL